MKLQQIAACIIDNWINPFTSDGQLCHLASGQFTTDEIQLDPFERH